MPPGPAWDTPLRERQRHRAGIRVRRRGGFDQRHPVQVELDRPLGLLRGEGVELQLMAATLEVPDHGLAVHTVFPRQRGDPGAGLVLGDDGGCNCRVEGGSDCPRFVPDRPLVARGRTSPGWFAATLGCPGCLSFQASQSSGGGCNFVAPGPPPPVPGRGRRPSRRARPR